MFTLWKVREWAQFLLVGGVLFFLSNCDQKNKRANQGSLPYLNFQDSTTIYFPLDSETSSINNYYRIVELDGIPFFCFFNELNFRFYYYNLTNKHEFFGTAPLVQSGPNGVGKTIFAFVPKPDSTIILHSYYQKSLITVNWEGEVLQRRKLKTAGFPISSSTAPFAAIDRSFFIYSNLSPAPNRDVNTMPLLFEWQSNEDSLKDWGIRMPEFYQQKGDFHYHSRLSKVTLGYNLVDQRILLGLPLQDSIWVVDREKETIDQKYFGHPDFELNPQTDWRQVEMSSVAEMKVWLGSDRYSTLMYDAMHKLYFRRFYWRIPEALLERDQLKSKSVLLVADSTFNLLGQLPYNFSEKQVIYQGKIYQFQLRLDQEDSLMVNVYTLMNMNKSIKN